VLRKSRRSVFRWPNAHDYCAEGGLVKQREGRWKAGKLTVLGIGTDSSQGKGQIISNINACLAVQATIRSTLGPYGGDLLMVDANGRQTITNDGATVMKVINLPLEFLQYSRLTDPSFLILYTPQHESSQTLRDHRMLKWEMERHLWLYWLARF
jgi:hypothetical protein